MDVPMDISPDGKYIFNGSRNIFQVGRNQEYDMKYVRNLGRSFTDIAFNLADRQFYMALKEKKIIVSDYDTFKEKKIYSTQGEPEFLHYHKGKVISVSKFKPEDKSDAGSYGIEIIKVQ